MRKSLLTITVLFFGTILISYIISSCKKEINITGIQFLQQEIPDGFPQPVYNFEDNPLSKEGVELGRKLFYDARLSADNQVSCGSCHEQRAGFGTFNMIEAMEYSVRILIGMHQYFLILTGAPVFIGTEHLLRYRKKPFSQFSGI